MTRPTDATPAEVAAAELSVLSVSQRECLVLVCKGLSHDEIAALLGRSKSTVDNHVQQACSRLQVSRIEAVVLAVKAGWV